jgi:DNA-binding transcriptional LysR family regulator
MDWDDLRYVLAIARGGGLSGAARSLGVNNSSVYRRLEGLEKSLEVRLFDRLRSGYRLTPAGEALAEAAARMESEAHSAERHVRGTDVRVEGHLRMSTSDAVAAHLLPPLLAEFRDLHPGLTLDISATNLVVDLTKRDADVVIRATTAPPEHLVGRSVGNVAFASYATPSYLDRVGRGRPLAEYEWLGFDGILRHLRQYAWLEKNVPESRIRLRFDHFGALRNAGVAGIGCMALPCFACDDDPALERIPNTYQTTDLQFWVLTHPDLRRSARVRAFLQFFGTRLSAMEHRLLGIRPTAAPVQA